MSTPKNPFDPAQFAEFLSAFDPAKYVPDMSDIPTGPESMKAAQQRNLDMLADFGKTGAEAYKAAFAAQLTMMQEALQDMGGSAGAAASSAMQDLADGVQKANDETLRQLADQFEQGAEALRALAEKKKT